MRDDKPLANTYVDYGFMKNKVPSGTGTHIFQTGKLNRSGRLDRTGISTKELPRNKTDHVSYEPPTSNRPNQRAYDIDMTKPRYSANVQDSDPWNLEPGCPTRFGFFEVGKLFYEEKIRLNQQQENI